MDAIWLSPIYPSPMADFGYDVSDYTDIAPLFGTLDDFDEMLGDVHRRGLRVILDFVPNHTSDQHPWFIESRASRDNPKRDWYIWRDPAPDGGPPNNWLGAFGGGAWEWDERTRQYYLHTYIEEQPDLNWCNPEVRRAMYDVLRFWLARGVDGFRVDALWHLIKDDQFRDEFRDEPPNPGYQPEQAPYHRLLHIYSGDRPEVHDVIAEMRKVLEEYGNDRLLIGEVYLPLERLVAYYGKDLSGVHLPFNFQLIHAPWKARQIATIIDEYEACLPFGCWPNWVLGNHDKPRIASRVGTAQAPVAALLLLTLRGTPTIYYGDEIGMEDVPIPPEHVQDPWEKNVPGLGLGRDPVRTPMQWDDSPNAGFTTGKPWLPVADNYRSRNVEAQREDPHSILALHRSLIALRRTEPALPRGSYQPVAAEGDVLAYIRQHGENRLLVTLNLGFAPHTLTFREPALAGRVILSTHTNRADEAIDGGIELRGGEGVIVRLK